MDRIIEALVAVVNWLENTAPREFDPDEVITLKHSERMLVVYTISSLFLFAVTLLVEHNAPEATGALLPVATIYLFISKSLVLLTMASLGMLLYHLARGAWAYHRLNRY